MKRACSGPETLKETSVATRLRTNNRCRLGCRNRQSFDRPSEPWGGVMARLLSLNVGLPRDVSWQGRTVHTGIWKEPVQGPRMVRRLNVDGDGQGDLAGHGGEHRAVFVYQIDSYRYWRKQLDRTISLTGSSVRTSLSKASPDDEVCIGDRYRVGPRCSRSPSPGLPATGSASG